jgi:predicted AAA+ superfamily ATPase
MRFDLGDLISVVSKLPYVTSEAPAYLFLDEVTYARDWALWLKSAYDDRKPVRIIGDLQRGGCHA